MSDAIEIEIINWNKYQPRRDIKHPRYFAMSNQFFDDPDVFGLNSTDVMVWFYVLCQASKKRSPLVQINIGHIEFLFSKFMPKNQANSICESLSKFEKRQWIRMSVRDPYVICTQSVRDPYADLNRIDLNRIERERVKKDSPAKNPPALHPLVEIWNSHCGDQLPKVRKSNAARDRRATRVWGENTADERRAIVERVSRSAFCVGKNERGWKATFDWLLQPESHLKISEGKYDGQQASSKSVLDTLREG